MSKKFYSLIFVFTILLSGLAFAPYFFFQTKPFTWKNYANIYNEHYYYSIWVNPDESAQIIHQEPGWTIKFDFPVGCVEERKYFFSHFSFYDHYLYLHPLPTGLRLAGKHFYFNVNEGYWSVFKKPVSIEFTYDEAFLNGANEEDLYLYFWNREIEQWSDAACGAYQRDLENNILTVPVCYVGRFALVGVESAVYLPLVSR